MNVPKCESCWTRAGVLLGQTDCMAASRVLTSKVGWGESVEEVKNADSDSGSPIAGRRCTTENTEGDESSEGKVSSSEWSWQDQGRKSDAKDWTENSLVAPKGKPDEQLSKGARELKVEETVGRKCSTHPTSERVTEAQEQNEEKRALLQRAKNSYIPPGKGDKTKLLCLARLQRVVQRRMASE